MLTNFLKLSEKRKVRDYDQEKYCLKLTQAKVDSEGHLG